MERRVWVNIRAQLAADGFAPGEDQKVWICLSGQEMYDGM